MLDVRIQNPRLPEPKVMTGEHRARMIGVARSGVRSHDAVTLQPIEPADQIPPRASNAKRAHH